MQSLLGVVQRALRQRERVIVGRNVAVLRSPCLMNLYAVFVQRAPWKRCRVTCAPRRGGSTSLDRLDLSLHVLLLPSRCLLDGEEQGGRRDDEIKEG